MLNCCVDYFSFISCVGVTFFYQQNSFKIFLFFPHFKYSSESCFVFCSMQNFHIFPNLSYSVTLSSPLLKFLSIGNISFSCSQTRYILSIFPPSISQEIQVFLRKKYTVNIAMETSNRPSEEMVPFKHQETQH